MPTKLSFSFCQSPGVVKRQDVIKLLFGDTFEHQFQFRFKYLRITQCSTQQLCVFLKVSYWVH